MRGSVLEWLVKMLRLVYRHTKMCTQLSHRRFTWMLQRAEARAA